LLTQGKEHILKVSERIVLSRIFGSNEMKVIRGWEKLHNEELHNLSSAFDVAGSRLVFLNRRAARGSPGICHFS